MAGRVLSQAVGLCSPLTQGYHPANMIRAGRAAPKSELYDSLSDLKTRDNGEIHDRYVAGNVPTYRIRNA